MKVFTLLALCLSAVIAEDFQQRPNIEKIHYGQHQQTVQEARSKVGGQLGLNLDGQSFEEIGSYGGSGDGTVGFSSNANLGLAGGSYGSSSLGASHTGSSGLSSQYGQSLGSSYTGHQSSGLVSGGSSSGLVSSGQSLGGSYAGRQSSGLVSGGSLSGSYGGSTSSSLQSSGSYGGSTSGSLLTGSLYGGSSSLNSGSSGLLNSGTTTSGLQSSGSYGGLSTGSLLSGSALSGQSYGGSLQHESSSQSSNLHSSSNLIGGLTVPVQSIGSDRQQVQQEDRLYTSQTTRPNIQWAPSGSSEKYTYHQEKIVEQQPQVQVVVQPGGSREAYHSYRKVTSEARPSYIIQQPSSQLAIQESSSQTTNSQSSGGVGGGYLLGGLGTHGSLTGGSLLGLGSLSSQNLISGLQSQQATAQAHQAYLAHQVHQALQTHQANQAHLGASLGASLGSQSHYGATHGSQFGSSLAAQNQFGSSTGLDYNQLNRLQQQLQSGVGVGGSFGASSGLSSYISEAERLAREQSQGLQVGGVRTGGSQHGSINAESLNNLGGVGGGGYQTKQWEKQSKWSSQSEFDSDGHVKNFKELSTGESENYDINGKRGGYKAATSTLDDNGKVSSYSLHT